VGRLREIFKECLNSNQKDFAPFLLDLACKEKHFQMMPLKKEGYVYLQDSLFFKKSIFFSLT
jgi:hypothetical protein